MSATHIRTAIRITSAKFFYLTTSQLILKFLPLTLLIVSAHFNDQQQQHSSSVDRQQNARSPVESLFGQVAKTVVYGGAAFARFNSRLLCPLLGYESERDNEDQPTLFVFNNPLNRESAYRLYSDDEITKSMLDEAQFDPKQMTIILVHGWLGGIYNELWLSEAKNVALRAVDSLRSTSPRETLWPKPWQAIGSKQVGASSFRPNVIIVEWSEFAHGSLYTATQNSFKVSRRLARLLGQLVSVAGLRPELMHCLGHSIGTHICGQAARQAFPAQPRPAGSSARSGPQRRMGRITGLDPGGFCYELGIKNETTYLGLKPSDALLVDAYYSNRSPFGNKYQVGQYNVRINNAFFQRPCSVWRNPNVARDYFRAAVRFLMGNVGNNDILSCDHYFSTRFAHQLPGPACSYMAYACSGYRDFVRGRCGLCTSSANCYSMDFEYQRHNSSVENALEHIYNHSSFYNTFTNKNEHEQAQAGQQIGQVAYKNRRVYYMRVNNVEPYCSVTFRVLVKLDREVVDLRSFRNEWLRLRFLGDGDQTIRVRDANSGKLTEAIGLHGPWAEPSDGTNPVERHDNRTLTAMIELPQPNEIEEKLFSADAIIKNVVVIYDNDLNRRQGLLVNPIASIQIDYLSSSNKKIRSDQSNLFVRQQFKVQFKHLDEAFSNDR